MFIVAEARARVRHDERASKEVGDGDKETGDTS